MILEIVTLAVLAGVVAVKYGAHTQANRLRLRLFEAQNLQQRNKQRLEALLQEQEAQKHETAERKEEETGLQEHLKKIKQDLIDQEERNASLQEGIDRVWE